MYESDAYTESVVKTVTVSEMIKWKSVYCCSVFSDPTVPPPEIPFCPILTPTQTHHILTQTYPDIDTDTPLTVTDTPHPLFPNKSSFSSRRLQYTRPQLFKSCIVLTTACRYM